MPHLPSPEEIEASKTRKDGWSRATLQSWGVPWPPPSGWRQDLHRRWQEKNPGQHVHDFNIPGPIEDRERSFHKKRAEKIIRSKHRTADEEVYAHLVLGYEALIESIGK